MRQYVVLQLLVLFTQSLFGTSYISAPTELSQFDRKSRIEMTYDQEINQTIYFIDGIGYETEETYWSRIIPEGFVDIILDTCRDAEYSKIAYVHALALHESTYNPRPSDKTNLNGTSDHGLFQINEININDPWFNTEILNEAADYTWDPYDNWANARSGIKLLKWLETQFEETRHVLYGYNWGPGYTKSYLEGYKIPPRDTVEYTNRIIRDAKKIEEDIRNYKYRIVSAEDLNELLIKIFNSENPDLKEFPIMINPGVLTNEINVTMYEIEPGQDDWIDTIAYNKNVEIIVIQIVLDTIFPEPTNEDKDSYAYRILVMTNEKYVIYIESIECDKTWDAMIMSEYEHNTIRKVI